MTEYKGFSLFDDVEDLALRSRNRAVIMANICANHNKDGNITPGGAALVMGYFNSIPQEEKAGVLKLYVQRMYEEGFKIEQ